MSLHARKTQKFPILVELQMADGSAIFGKVFLSPQGRLSDLMNDERNFLPFERGDGSFTAIAKSQIRRVSPIVQSEDAYKGDNALKILGLSEGATREDIKRAYREQTLIHHPDKLRGLGLGHEHLEIATRTMTRLNEAYQRALQGLDAAAAE
jgi:DnaJ-domain-containing protein 1